MDSLGVLDKEWIKKRKTIYNTISGSDKDHKEKQIRVRGQAG